MKTRFVIAGPDDFIGNEPDIGECARGMAGVGDDFFRARLQAIVIKHMRVMGVSRADVIDITLLPDPVGDAHDVVDDVVVNGIKSAERLAWPEVGRDALFTRRAARRVGGQRDRVIGRHMLAAERNGQFKGFRIHQVYLSFCCYCSWDFSKMLEHSTKI